MGQQLLVQEQFNGGISVSDKMGAAGSFAFARGLDIHTDPAHFQLAVAPVKVSGTTVVGLIKWICRGTPYDTNTYFYDVAGNIYKEDTSGNWGLIHTCSSSHGQGMVIFQDYLYYVQDTQVGRYGPLDGTPTWTDAWQTGLNNTAATGFAPVTNFTNLIVIGNGNQISTWDGTNWTLNKITLVPGHNVRAFGTLQEYMCWSTWRSNDGVIYDSEEGYIFFWDGASYTYNFFIDLPEGAGNAIQNSRNSLLAIIGSQGILYSDTLTYSNQFSKMQSFPYLKPANYVEVYPGAMTTWAGKTYFGVSNSDSPDIVRGVYEWGSINAQFQEVMNCPYTISTGNYGTGVQIGAVEGLGKALYIAWSDSTSGTTVYGVDKVIRGNPFAASGSLDLFFFDNGQAAKLKDAGTVKATHSVLNAGEGVTLGFRRHRGDAFTYGVAGNGLHLYSSAEDSFDGAQTRFNVEGKNKRFAEFQARCTLTSGGATTPVVTSLALRFDDLKGEDYF